MDITALFKASVKTARLRNKSLPPPDKNRILPLSSSRSEFTIKTKDICHQITQLRNLLIENRSAYMRFGFHLKSAVQMTDYERDIIDEESEKIFNICTQFIGDLRTECSRLRASKQGAQHMEAVLELLAEYLRSVYRIYTQQKEYRVRHELDTYKLLKLESNKKLIPVIPGRTRARIDLPTLIAYDTDDEGDDDSIGGGSGSREHLLDEGSGTSRSRVLNRSVTLDEDSAARADIEESISADDIQMFESENVHLYNEFKGLSDEVEQIEKNVVDIARLQDIFTEKVNMAFQSDYCCIEIYIQFSNSRWRFKKPTSNE